MRRFAITAFALLYVVAVVSLTAERNSDWAVRQRTVDHLAKFQKADTHVSQTKILESHFVVEAPHEVEGISIHSERLLLVQPTDRKLTRTAQLLPPRAPPTLL
jgi:hypothetical protein